MPQYTKADARDVVRISRHSSRDVGGCNGCARHIDADGGREHRVWRLVFAYRMEVRLCSRCLHMLQGAVDETVDEEEGP